MTDFEIVNGTLRKYNGSGPNVKIPEGVVEISTNAFNFHEGQIEKIELPSTLLSIAPRAFCAFGLIESITIPEYTMEIGEGAFARCTGLKKIELLGKDTKVSSSAFNRCVSVNEIKGPLTRTQGAPWWRRLFPDRQLYPIAL